MLVEQQVDMMGFQPWFYFWLIQTIKSLTWKQVKKNIQKYNSNLPGFVELVKRGFQIFGEVFVLNSINQ